MEDLKKIQKNIRIKSKLKILCNKKVCIIKVLIIV